MDSKPKTDIFVGSFDPYTIRHDSIVRRILPLSDCLVIGVSVNMQKKYRYSEGGRTKAIGDLYADEPCVSMKSYHGLAVDFAKREDAKYPTKGVRSVRDFEYECEQTDTNRQIGGVDIILFFADPGMISVSSPLVYELLHYGADASMFFPQQKIDYTRQIQWIRSCEWKPKNGFYTIIYNIDGAKMPKIKKCETSVWIKVVVATYGCKIGEVGYMFVDDEKILEVNNEYSGHDYYTDTIILDYDEGDIINGDIAISLDTVRTNAERLGKPYEEELYRVIIHGILYLCGINDKGPGERETMEVAEDKALAMRKQKTT